MGLKWEHRYGSYRAPAPLFGHIRVEDYGSGRWQVLWSAPGITDLLMDASFQNEIDALVAAENYAKAEVERFLKDMQSSVDIKEEGPSDQLK